MFHLPGGATFIFSVFIVAFLAFCHFKLDPTQNSTFVLGVPSVCPTEIGAEIIKATQIRRQNYALTDWCVLT